MNANWHVIPPPTVTDLRVAALGIAVQAGATTRNVVITAAAILAFIQNGHEPAGPKGAVAPAPAEIVDLAEKVGT